MERVVEAVNIMNDTIESQPKKGGELEVWQLHREHLTTVWENDGNGRRKKAPVHPVLLNWAIAFLARTSTSVYKEVAKVMMLPDICNVDRNTNYPKPSHSEAALSSHLLLCTR